MMDNYSQDLNLTSDFNEADFFADNLDDYEEFPEFKAAREKFKRHPAWSDNICDNYGTLAAISFAVGSDIMLDGVRLALAELSTMPAGTSLDKVQLMDPAAVQLKDLLPEQFLMNYDVTFLSDLKATVEQLRECARSGMEIVAHSVMQELVLYISAQNAKDAEEYIWTQIVEAGETEGLDESDVSDSWVFNLFGDMDVVTFLYSDITIPSDNIYHFDHWRKLAFYM